ncbi:DEAD/DEAH box helicase family protein [Paenibacillus sp. ACRSA]|uniref:DEAD/DEAH box helicase family protein n=1 Tax=Paenibacillus sp. ACRSA TaxID=2918211 RepID=UPI001EF552A5|nr:DEAD/DEAH box helicase family protein [Paenibacillus sp. ACRSA]MCG7377371.1 DEAD/DEAH box helicase family protein [Paenibacillus sp. ACRSA]
MTLNVDFLKDNQQWQVLHEYAVEAESNVYANPRTSLFYSRASLERAVRWMYSSDGYLEYPDKERYTLSDLIHTQSFNETIAQGLFQPIKLIVKLGNIAVHEDTPVTKDQSLLIFEHLFLFLSWLQDYYLDEPIKNLAFDRDMLPTTAKKIADSTEDLKKLEKKIDEKDASIQKIEEENASLKRQVDELTKRASGSTITMPPENEARTRQLIIDVMLLEAGWNPHGQNVRELHLEGMPNRTGIGYVDYVLWSDSGLPLAIIEAKSTVNDARKGKQQAQLYANHLEEKYGQRPIIFYTNGYETWIWDDMFYPPRLCASFYSKADLDWAVQKRNERKVTSDYRINSMIAGRVYQIEAIKRVAETYESSRRKTLLVMATGTGKTRTAIALVDFLKRAGWAKNVLFLADRRELVKQAAKEFKKHLPSVTTCNLLEDKDDPSARIYFSTYQTMLSFIQPGVKPKFSVGFFDLIIIDEAHRSIYNKFGTIFQYFDSLLLGLTATPKSDVDHDTYTFFGLKANIPTFAYEYEKAIEDKNLVPVKPVSVFFKFLHDGIDRDELSEEEQEEYDKRVMPHKQNKKVTKEEVNKFLFNKDTVRQALEILFEHGIKVAGGDRLGKTIIFARNNAHAHLIVEVFDEMMPHLKGKFASEIHYKVDYAETLIENFKQADKDPHIAVSVDMLDTGIDVPEVVNLVLFKPVFSITKFWQMIGRGTRLSEDLFAPDVDKTHALLFDLCGNVEYFKFTKKEEPKSTPIHLTGQLFVERVHLIRELYASGRMYDEIRNELIDTLTKQLVAMDEHHFAIRPHIPLLTKFRNSESWERIEDRDFVSLTDEDGFAKLVYDAEPEDKKRIDLLHVKLQRSVLGVAIIPGADTKKKQLQTIAETLYRKRIVSQVADHADMLREVMDVRFFDRTNAIDLDGVRKLIRELIRSLDKEQKVIVHTNFEDKLKEIVFDDILPSYGDFKDYNDHISEYVREHQDHIAIQKLKRNKSITLLDITSFADMLEEEQAGTKEQFNQHFGSGENNSFGIFVRGLLGLDRSAAQDAFAILLQKTNLNANQINFINMIIDYLSVNGILEPSKLLDQPFVTLHHEGVYGLFDEKTVDEIVSVMYALKESARVKIGFNDTKDQIKFEKQS